MTEKKDIGVRLENWARWATAKGSRGSDCMTGTICEGLRKAALGNVWSGHGDLNRIDEADAIVLELGMRKLEFQMRLLLWWCYIEQARPEVVCRKLSIPTRPASEFVERFRAAQEAIEDIVDSGNR